MRVAVVLLVFAVFCTAEFPDASLWNSVVSTYVHANVTLSGIEINQVDYVGIASDPNFSAFITALAAVPASTFQSFNYSEFYAFMINAYNAFAVNTIVTHMCERDTFGSCGPLPGIRDAGPAFGSVWKQVAGTLAGQQYSLDDIENSLRQPPNGWVEDSRLHAAIVCASISCPNLRNEAFNPSLLDAQLTDQMTTFLANPAKGMLIDTTTSKVTLSSIFYWFAADFAHYGGVLPFVATYAPSAARATLTATSPAPALAYFEYNWSVNGPVQCATAKRPCLPVWGTLTILGGVLVVVEIVVIVRTCRWRLARRYSRIDADANAPAL